jgi:plasmid segregation protein ParM
MEFEIVGKYDSFKGFAGPLAAIESEYGGTVFGTSKNHQDARMRVLLAIHRNLLQPNIRIVVCQPYKGHATEKDEIAESLKGQWSITINNIKKDFEIEDVKVGIEGAMAFQSAPMMGPINIIDVGSGTVNCIHFLNKKIVDRKCDTLPFGTETSKSGKNLEGIASGIFKNMSGVWIPTDPTFVCGGSAEEIMPILKRHYKNIEVLPSKANINGIKIAVNAELANAVGAYFAGVKLYGQLQTT